MGQSQSGALTVEAVAWCEEAGEMLADSLFSAANVAELKAQAEAGAVLFRVHRDGKTAAYYLLRVDGREGVLVAAAGRDEIDLTAAVLPHIERQFIGCEGLRIHTGRPGLVRKLAALGYGGVEFVLRKKLNGNQPEGA